MLAQQYEENLNIANTIKNALLTDLIVPFYQPIVDLTTLKVKKVRSFG